MPSARSRASAPVGMASTPTLPRSPSCMIEPLPNCFSIWPSAMSSALSRSTCEPLFCLSARVVVAGKPSDRNLTRGCDIYDGTGTGYRDGGPPNHTRVILCEQTFGMASDPDTSQPDPRRRGHAGGEARPAIRCCPQHRPTGRRRRTDMRPTIRLGRIAGIEVGVHWSLLVDRRAPRRLARRRRAPGQRPRRARLLLRGRPCSRSGSSSRRSSRTSSRTRSSPRRRGQQVNGITLWLLGGVSELGTESKNARDELHVAIAGPATSLALGATFGALAFAFGVDRRRHAAPDRRRRGSRSSTSSSRVFNLLPGAPLDGGRVLAALLWKRNGDRRRAQITAARAGRVARHVAHRRFGRARRSPATTSSSPRSWAGSC